MAALELLVNDYINKAIPKRHNEKRNQKKNMINMSTLLKICPINIVYQMELYTARNRK